MHISHPSYPSGGLCNPYETISAGIAYGNIGGVAWTNRAITEVQTAATGQVCTVYDGGVSFLPPGAIFFRIWRNGANWQVDVWLGYWATIKSATTTWGVAAEVEYGQELWAANNDLTNIWAPVNFIHKAAIAGTNNSTRPWDDRVLVSPLNGITHGLPNSVPPLQVMDGISFDYTSMSSHNIH